MARFTEEDKINAVQSYLEGKESYSSISTSLGTSSSMVMNWVAQYNLHGIEGLLKKSYTSYPEQFKLDVLNYMNDNGTSPNETAVIFNISSPGMIRKWRILYEKGGVDALKPKKKRRTLMKKDDKRETKNQKSADGSMEALKAEVKHLRMENEYLKKLNTLIQNREKSPNKTKRK